MKNSYLHAIVAFGLCASLAAGVPTTRNGCVNRCQYGNLCFAPRQYWTDSEAGCVQYQCIATTNESDGSTTYSVGALGCADYQPPTDGMPYVEVPGDSTAAYPDCCDKIVLLQEQSSNAKQGRKTSSSGCNSSQ